MSKTFLRQLKIPHVFPLLAGMILFCALLTYFIPSGEFQREEIQIGELTRTVVLPGTFTELPKNYSLKGLLLGDPVEGEATPASVLQILSAIPRGMENSADIIFFIFIIGGVFGVLQQTGAITAAIGGLVNRFADSGPTLTIVLMIVISIGGSTLGMGEEFIPLVPVFLFISNRLGYDRIYGLALVMLAADVGFAAATTNPFTVQIAQGIAEVPLGSDLGFRVVFYIVCLLVTLIYVLRYGVRIKKDPSKSHMPDDGFGSEEFVSGPQSLERRHVWILISSALVFGLILTGTQTQGWWLNEMAGGFILMGILAAVIGKLSVQETTNAFIDGLRGMVVAALVVGFARAIQVVLTDGMILDSLIYYAGNGLQHLPKTLAAEAMFAFQTFLNFFIPSGSGQAATTMPLMAPLSDVLGLSRQTAVFAFTCGDGFSNTIIPTSGVLMAMLALAKVPYQKWLRFVAPLFLQLVLVSAVFLAISVWMNR